MTPQEQAQLQVGIYPRPTRQLELIEQTGIVLRIVRHQIIDPPDWLDPATATLLAYYNPKAKTKLRGCRACGNIMVTSPTRKRCLLCRNPPPDQKTGAASMLYTIELPLVVQ